MDIKDDFFVLGIETSCDETSAAVVRNGREILSNVISSQTDAHRKFGGVVPEIASRKHVELVIPVIDEALKEAGLSIPGDISVVGYDDEEISRHLHPALTTVVLPHRAMGQWAVERLATARDSERPVHPVGLACTLVERNSVARPRG